MERHWRRPKYLAQNFLTTALQHRKAQLDNMLIVPPQHMEFIDSYVHRGWVTEGVLDGNTYDKPWQWLIRNQAVYNLDDLYDVSMDNEGLSCDDEPIGLEFTALISTCSADCIQLEKCELLSERSHRLESEETGSDFDLFLLSQDIDSAIDHFLPSSSPKAAHSTIPNEAQLPKEEFLPAKLNSWDIKCSNDGDYMLESPEPPSHLSDLLVLLPTADDLVTRLKPKLIHDPFLNDKGQPFTHQRLFSDDSILDEDLVQSAECITSNNRTKEWHPLEQFSRDDSIAAHNSDGTDLDPILEICIDDVKGETLSLVASNEPHVQLPSPDKEFMNALLEGSADSTELWKSVGETGQQHLGGLQCERRPLFSPTVHFKMSDSMDFVKLNSHDVSHDSDDSGLGHALLESPLLPPPLSPPTATPLTRQLAKLEPFPLSPGEKMIILSSAHKQKILLQLWQRDKVFDTVLALTLPYPDIEDALLSKEVNTVAGALLKLGIKALKLDGDAELELTWDPLGESCHEMIVAEQSLISKQPFEFVAFITLGRNYASGKWREIFKSDSWVKSINEEGMEMPLSFHSTMREGSEMTKTVSNLPQAESDIPYLNLGHRNDYGYQCRAPTSVASNSYTELTELDVSSKEHSPKRLDPQAAAWEIIELSNSRIGSNSSAVLYSSLRGNRDQTRVVESLTATCGRYGNRNRQHFSSPAVVALNDTASSTSTPTEDTIGSFMMLRFSGSTPERKRVSEGEDTNLRNGDGDGDDMELIWSETVTMPSIHDVHLVGEYRAVVDKVEEHAASLLAICKSRGLRLPARCSVQQQFPADSVKFFLKERQKMLEDVCNTERAGEVFQSCQLAAGLFLVGTVLDMLTHCSLSAAIRKFTSLTEKYRELIVHSSLEPLREGLSQLQTACREHRADPHPKLREIMNIVRHWMKSLRKSWKEKIVIVTEREFNALSGDILDFLQVIPGLKSCVFSFSSNGHSDPLYAKAIEERFFHYDCVVVPESSVAGQASFPWEKVTLLIEYEPLKQPLFDQNGSQGQLKAAEASDFGEKTLSVDRLKLREYVTLNTAFKPSDEGVHIEDMLQYQYKLIGSENVANNGELLQLLESKYNIVVVERDYHSHFKGRLLQEGKPKSFNCSYADIIVDQSVGIVLRPVSLLSTDAGLKAVISTTTALSFQFEACWILLYLEDHQQYPFSGSAPTNLARLHASISHYSTSVDCYQVKIVIASDLEETAHYIRRIAEDTHRNSKIWNMERWMEREWLHEEMTEREKVLLTFPCINSFSAQLMLDKFSLMELLAMELHQLQETLSWMPMKILELFHKICHISAMADVGHFNERCDSIMPTHTSDYDQPLKSDNRSSIAPSFHTSKELVQHGSSVLRDKTQHVRFNVYDLHSSDSENGLTAEELSSVSEVIVLSSDEEGPPKPKKARQHPTTNTDLFPNVESTCYNHVGESGVVNVLPPSHQVEPDSLNDSLEEFVMLPPLECPISKVQSAPMDQYQGALHEQSTIHAPDHFQSDSTYNGIYGNFHITIGDQNSTAVSTPSYSKQDNLYNQSFTNPSITRSSSNSAVNLLTSTSWEGKTPTQKQIRQSVMNSLADFHPKPGSYDPFPPLNNHVTNTARMAREYFSGAPPPGFVAGAIIRKSPPHLDDNRSTTLPSVVQRTPVKSLSLGHEDRKMIRLQSNDRAITVGSQAYEPTANYPHAPNIMLDHTGSHQWQRTYNTSGSEGGLITDGNNYSEIKGNYPNMNATGVSKREQALINRFADLKAFHQLQHQPSVSRTYGSLPVNDNFNVTTGIANGSKRTESQVIDDPWMGCGVIGPPARAKRPHPGSVGGPSISHSLPPPAPDGLVPSASIISPSLSTSMDSSLYGSPNTSTGSIKLSPLQKRRLIYQRDPGSADGQTKLRFR